MNENIGDLWCKIEIYNEYLKKITALLMQVQTVEKMQALRQFRAGIWVRVPTLPHAFPPIHPPALCPHLVNYDYD